MKCRRPSRGCPSSRHSSIVTKARLRHTDETLFMRMVQVKLASSGWCQASPAHRANSVTTGAVAAVKMSRLRSSPRSQ